MRKTLSTLTALALFAASPLVQAGGPFQSELLHMDLPQLSASASAATKPAAPAVKLGEASKTNATQVTSKPRTRAEVIAELREARANGELDFAAAEVGLPAGSLIPSTRLAGKPRNAAEGEPALGQR